MKMNEGFMASMQEAMQLLQTEGPQKATEAIQRALRGMTPDDGNDTMWAGSNGFARNAGVMPAQVVEALLPRSADIPASAPAQQKADRKPVDQNADSQQASGRTVAGSYSNAAGGRDYRLYEPGGKHAHPMPLIVMLHGCTQDADDFAAGTGMNALADVHGFLVLYPIQPSGANHSKCWNWFRPEDQQSDRGEPSLIAGMTRKVMAEHSVDPRRVYVAGLSAGGAMAAIMVRSYPELYAAAGVHSGLPDRCAHDLPSALAAMRGGKGPLAAAARAAAPPQRPVIVFHGDADKTVHSANGDRLVAPYANGNEKKRDERRENAGGRTCTVRSITSSSGIDAEYWRIHGAGHAWSGGNPAGSHTDARGPDASAEMVRFFLANARRL